MSGEEIGRAIYLILLLTMIGGYFFVSNRQRLGKSAQQAAIWVLIFVAAIAGFGLWGDIRTDLSPRQTVFADSGRIEVPRSLDGHYYLTAQVNGAPIEFVVDTGATDVVLTRADAAKAGITEDQLRFIGQASTANGTVRTAPIRLQTFAIGPLEVRGLRAWVNEGELHQSLLGMSYLQRFDTVSFSNGLLLLHP